jgi:hypothetical protein
MSQQKMTATEIMNAKADRIMRGVNLWCSFYRANPHRFCKDYLNVHLKLFQQILLVMMNIDTNLIYLAARGQGKTFLTALYCVCRCILYPGTKICLASKTRKQGMEVLEKIRTIFYPNSANLRLEIKEIVTNQVDAHITFHNTSEIFVRTAGESARGARANILIVDEYRLVPKEIIDTILRKFLTAPRMPEFMNRPEYASYPVERNKEIYLTSCWYKSHWAFEKAKGYFNNLRDDTKMYFICGLPYQLSIKEGLLSAAQIADEMSEDDFSPTSFSMEMGCLWYDNSNGLYNFEDVSRTRKIKFPYLPPEISNKIKDPRLKIPPKPPGETRIISMDIALMSSKVNRNDASAIFVNFLNESRSGNYTSNIVYTESFEGITADKQALRIRKLFEEYECDYLVIDKVGVGMGVIDLLLSDIYDPDTGVTYPGISCCNNEEIAARCTIQNAEKVIWAIDGSARLNSECAIGLRDAFQRGLVRLPVSDIEAEEYLYEIKGFAAMSIEEQNQLRVVYKNFALLVEELVNLDYQARDNVIRVQEKSGARKDRYSSLSYNVYVARLIARDLANKKNSSSSLDSIMFRNPTISRFGKTGVFRARR